MTANRLQKTYKQFNTDFLLTPNSLTIEARTPNDDFFLRTELSNGSLPISFTNVFDSVAEVFQFVRKEEGSVQVGLDFIKFVVKVMKVREIRVQMERVAVSKEEVLGRRMEKIEKKTSALQNYLEATLPKLTHKLVEEFVKKSMKPFNEEIKRFNEKIVSLQEKVRQNEARYRIAPPSLFGKTPFNPINPAKEADPEVKNGTSKQGKSSEGKKVDSEVAQMTITPGQKGDTLEQPTPRSRVLDFIFDVDQTNKFIEYYTIDKNTITKKRDNQQIIMLYASNPIPPTDRHSIKFRVNQITDGFIWIGLISEAKKAQQYIGQEQGIIQFSLEGNQVLINGKAFPLNFQEFKSGTVIGMQVQISTRKIRFYRNGKATAMLKLTLPESMTSTKLYPYIQMVNNGDSITFL